MKIHHIKYPEIPETGGNEYSVAAGFFDGIHRGHQEVIGHAMDVAREKGLSPAVMTFDPHPSAVLGNRKEVTYITPYKQKMQLLEEMGTDTVFVISFTGEFASMTPEQFVECYIRRLGIRHITCGFDFSFGRFGKGKPDDLERLSEGDYGVSVIGKVTEEDEKISSTRIRSMLSEGDVSGAAQLLGRPLMTDGTVIEGDKRGRLIGFPTANVDPVPGSCLPAPGVYAVTFETDGRLHAGVLNAGYRPTFKDPSDTFLSVEVHLLDFEGELYDKPVRVRWIRRIREERKFAGIDELKAQIGRDREEARLILAAQHDS
ncbi:Riboflavin biosynthesis protein ribF [Bhargavaea cecembensis DSE10]|uniref:Riboflavin biosynthesis protein n=1 Tax=Bhargavaea cecembensis DSE10 TaxID=1235279 RepID=M7NG25_9BACL|nr:bifunctional riboflavin kinase/FAD synthetase [Bhargavaea cecembensis]EMR07508.1 Riboflavin biosynthesis protein ribF [Bhargavaea cecembensis DSE10]